MLSNVQMLRNSVSDQQAYAVNNRSEILRDSNHSLANIQAESEPLGKRSGHSILKTCTKWQWYDTRKLQHAK